MRGSQGLGIFYSDAEGLESSAQYFYRCWVTNTGGDACWAAETQEFRTPGTPVISNAAPADISSVTCRMQGTLVYTNHRSTEVWMYWGTNDGGSVTSAWEHSEYFGVQSEGLLSPNIMGAGDI